MNRFLSSVKILGTRITTSPKNEVLDFIIRGLKKRDSRFYIVTPNPEMLVYAQRLSSYQRILNNAQISLPDGIGVVLAGSIAKNRIKSRITGIDLMLEIVEKCANEGLSIGLLGGRDGVAERTAECLLKMHPGLIVSFVGGEWNENRIKNYEFRIMNRKNKSTLSKYRDDNLKLKANSYNLRVNYIDILFVAFGVPKQEEWIAKNLRKIPVTCAMGVGGSFDYISGKVRRAPKVVRNLGFEWLFRLVIEPWRIKRQLALPKFVYMVLKERLL